LGAVMHVDQIVKRIESMISQLEGLRFTKKVLNAAQLQGHIEEALEVGGLSWTETWRKRVDTALRDVNVDEPKPRLVDDSGLAALMDKNPGIAPVTPSPNSGAGLKPPQI
jgi:hypothetical protein